ncbi:hypothetical protein GWO43_05885 [candidate division KSB1 bacterium]|nr:hypothetical protein [candidate division KSB1 bacterium]NIU08396.1 hypothetical protein [Phycisphaerae bacterium]NIW11063.1 hypothetical protein [Gammaproteobacteria bacterium]NIR71935.1 hypothetical protein [candidate division KSB1 bacterium]NIT70418.1 hypothetical protein [candidate division KSB1 bacterium]
MQNGTEINEADRALCRSALYEALALGFQTPRPETVERLLSEDQNQALSEIAAAVADEANNGNLSNLIRTLRNCTDSQDLWQLQASYNGLFGHVAHSPVPPYETEYGEETLFQQPQQLGDISGFYTAFGLQLNLQQHERVDNISCECEFLSFLTRKEVYALEQQDTEMVQETRKAQRLFLRDHLARFVPAFVNLLKREAPNSVYGVLGELCHQFVLMECQRFNIKAGPDHLRLRQKVVVDDCFSCGSGQDIIQDMCDSGTCFVNTQG